MVDTATPAPLPAGGQAPALLADRKAQQQAVIKRFKHQFGKPKGEYKPLPPDEFERRRQQVLKQFRELAAKKS